MAIEGLAKRRSIKIQMSSLKGECQEMNIFLMVLLE